MVLSSEGSTVADLAASENREELRLLVRAAGLEISDDLLDCLLKALAQGVTPSCLTDTIYQLSLKPAPKSPKRTPEVSTRAQRPSIPIALGAGLGLGLTPSSNVKFGLRGAK
jgi:hypothetical protein